MKTLKIGLLFICLTLLKKASASAATQNQKHLRNIFTGEIDFPSKPKPFAAESFEASETGFLQVNAQKEYITNNGDIIYTSPKYPEIKRESLMPQIKLNLVINIENGDGDCDGDSDSDKNKDCKTKGLSKKEKSKAKGKKAGISSTGFPSGKIRVLLDGEDINEMTNKAKAKAKAKVTTNSAKEEKVKDLEKSKASTISAKASETVSNENYPKKTLEEDTTAAKSSAIAVVNPITPPTAPAASGAAASTNQPIDWAAYFRQLNSKFENGDNSNLSG